MRITREDKFVTRFENAPFSERIKELGDTAEGVFETWAKKNNIVFVRVGFNRPPFKSFYKFAPELRLMPDYACEGTEAVLIEVKGCGKEGVKIKDESVSAMEFWHTLNKVKIFIYNSSSKSYCLIDLQDLIDKLDGKPRMKFPDGKTYGIIEINELSWEKV